MEPEKKEKIVTRKEAIKWLKQWFLKIDSSTIYQKKDFEKEENMYKILENECEMEIKPGYIIKWFAVRIDI